MDTENNLLPFTPENIIEASFGNHVILTAEPVIFQLSDEASIVA